MMMMSDSPMKPIRQRTSLMDDQSEDSNYLDPLEPYNEDYCPRCLIELERVKQEDNIREKTVIERIMVRSVHDDATDKPDTPKSPTLSIPRQGYGWSKVVTVLLLLLLVAMLVCWLTGRSVLLPLTWPYELFRSSFATSELTTLTQTETSFWLFPWWKRPVEVLTTTVLPVASWVKAVGYFLNTLYFALASLLVYMAA
jgi:hypothetical protein